jgi:hypothetical protein
VGLTDGLDDDSVWAGRPKKHKHPKPEEEKKNSASTSSSFIERMDVPPPSRPLARPCLSIGCKSPAAAAACSMQSAVCTAARCSVGVQV